MTYSLSIAHTPWKPERIVALSEMRDALFHKPAVCEVSVIETDYRGRPWNDVKHLWALETWHWHLDQGRDHCIMMSDDLHIMPGFWRAIDGMIARVPDQAIGCMSNHPKAPGLLAKGVHWYRTRAWLVGPCIIMPRPLLSMFVRWYEAWYPTLPRGRDAEGYQEFYHDDSSINEWLGQTGRDAYHPVPAPIEHRLELGRTHDANPFPAEAAESISWRTRWLMGRQAFEAVDPMVVHEMQNETWWDTEMPFLHVTSEERRLGIE